MDGRAGTFVMHIGGYKAFLPNPLPHQKRKEKIVYYDCQSLYVFR